MRAALGFDMDRSPRRLECIGKAFASAHKTGCARLLADGHHHTLANGKAACKRMRTHMVEHLRIDRLSSAAQSQLPQSGEIGFGKEMAQRAGRFLGDIDLAVLETLDQFIRRQVDDFQLGSFKHAIRHGLAHPHMGERGHDIVETFDMLDVDGREDVDAGFQQFLDILIALGVAAPRRIAVRQFIDQNELRPSFQYGIEIHLAKAMPLMLDDAARNDLMAMHQRFGFPAPMRLHDTDHHIAPRLAAMTSVRQHLPGLAHTRRRTQKHLETATAFLRGLAQEGLRSGSIAVRHAAGLAPRLSSRRFRMNTLTRGSPNNPNKGCSTLAVTNARTPSLSNPLFRAMRST